VSKISKPLTATSILPIPSVNATTSQLSTTVPSTHYVNTPLPDTHSGHSFPDIPDPLGIIKTMIGVEWHDKSYKTRIEDYKWYFFPPYLHLLYYDDKIDILRMLEPKPSVLDEAYKNIVVTPEEKKRFYDLDQIEGIMRKDTSSRDIVTLKAD